LHVCVFCRRRMLIPPLLFRLAKAVDCNLRIDCLRIDYRLHLEKDRSQLVGYWSRLMEHRSHLEEVVEEDSVVDENFDWAQDPRESAGMS
jgi:hypothetical protein